MAGKGKKTVTVGTLSEVEEEIRLRLRAVTLLKQLMKRRDLDEIRAMGRPMVTNGLRDVDRFIHSCKRALGQP